ncbi:hypothetical protein Z043_119354, partial [Scleropages formosus]
YVLSDPWRQEWEKGVQEPASPDSLPQPSVRVLTEQPEEVLFSRQTKYIQSQGFVEMDMSKSWSLQRLSHYDLDDMDLYWLEELNVELEEMGEDGGGLGIEYDEDDVRDTCRSPDSEEGNDMVFCDKCNICVHQACYDIAEVLEGCWLCTTCNLGIDPQCLLCPTKGGAMKATRAGTKWAHISYALWIPEVHPNPRMEPIIEVSCIPPQPLSAGLQYDGEHPSFLNIDPYHSPLECSVKSCVIPFHVICAFKHSLEMTILDAANEVKFKSYCLKHSKPKMGTVKSSSRAQKLQQLEENFNMLVWSEELAQDVGLPHCLLDFIFQYWKLKHKSNFKKALLPPQEEEDGDKIM